jgi:HK97 family phage portal protein
VVGFENARYEIDTTLIAESYHLTVDPDTREVFYQVAFSEQSEPMMAPLRNVMHLRLNATARDPFRGVSPIQHCAASLATNGTLSAFLMAYLNNRATPSFAVTTEQNLTREQHAQLKASWDEQTKLLKSGGSPLLSNGLKPVMLGVAPGDELLVDTFNLTVTDIARAFGMPKALLGIDETASNAENLYRAWVSLGLGALVETVEQGLERLFRLPRDERVEFDSDALLRLDSEAQARRVSQLSSSGVLSPDEARAVLGYGPINDDLGAVPYAQQQMVPLTMLTELHAANIAAKLRPTPTHAPAAQTEDTTEETPPTVTRAQVVDLIEKRRRRA